jgi:hypothetical protein
LSRRENEWANTSGLSLLDLTLHAQQKLETYGITGERLASWRAALDRGEPFVDRRTGARGRILQWEQRPWVVILRDDG